MIHKDEGYAFPCTVDACTFIFKKKQTMEDHVDSSHYGNRWACGGCSKQYPNRGTLNAHIKKHCPGAEKAIVTGSVQDQMLPQPFIVHAKSDVAEGFLPIVATTKRQRGFAPLPIRP